MLGTDVDRYITKRKGAIHVGAHVGGECIWYKQQGFTPVIWFEPCAATYVQLLQNIQIYDDQRAFNFGIHDTLTEAVLHTASNKGQSSSILPFGKHKDYYPNITYIGEEPIILQRLDSMFNSTEDINLYNFLNIDVQGVELNVLKSMGAYITHIDYIYTEVNLAELYVGAALIDEIDAYLAKFGFIRIWQYFTKKEWGDAFYKRYTV